MKYLLAIALSFFSLSSFAKNHTCVEKLYRQAHIRTVFGVAALPGFVIVGASLLTDASLLKRDARRIKSAHILVNRQNYTDAQVAKAQARIQRFYTKLLKEFPSSPLLIDDVVEALDDVYNNVIPDMCHWIIKSATYQPLLDVVFRFGALRNFDKLKALYQEAQKREKKLEGLRKVENAKSPYMN